MEHATRAINEMNGKWIFSKPIYVKFSEHPMEISNSVTPYPSIAPIVYVPTIVMPSSMLAPYSFVNQPSRYPPRYPYNRVLSDD